MRGLAKAVSLGVVLGLALVGAAAFLGQLRPSLRVKNYNLVLLGGEPTKLGVLGTHLTNDGMCTKIWLGDVLDTVVCASHLITEVAPDPTQQAPQGDPQPKPTKEARR